MIRSVVLSLLVLALPLAGSARSDAVAEDPDTVAARRHFDAGLELYGLERYVDAIREFELARAVRAIPAFDYNIGRCDERLERWADAIAAYERFLAASPPFAEESAQVRARLGVLRQRVAGRGAPRLPPRVLMRRLGIAALSIGAASLIAGTAAYLAVYPSYAHLRDTCGPKCDSGAVIPVWNRVQRAESAAIGLWSIAGVAAAIGIPLVVYSREHTERPLTLQVGAGSVGVRGVF
jgi:tetratricopeptide (TPR) repeat protein